MKITIIHKEGCPLCEAAIREFTGDGHEVEAYGGLEDVEAMRRCAMMTDILLAGGDKNAFPLVFIHDRFIPWQPKEQKGA